MQQVNWVVRPAANSEWEFALSIIPEVLVSPSLPQKLFVVTSFDHPKSIVASGAFIPTIKDAQMPGFPVFVRVLTAYRRKGIGKLLIRELAEQVSAWNVPYLLSWQAYAHGVEHAFLNACGFNAYLKVHKFQVVRESAHILLRLLERYQQKHSSLKEVQLSPLTDALIHQVAPLYCAHFMVSYEVGVQRLKQMIGLPQVSLLSSVAYLGSKPVGFIIGYLDQENIPKVDFWTISPELRNTATSLLLLCHFVRNAYGHGYSVARFDSNDHARSTIKIAARLNAQTLEVCESFAYTLNA